MKKKDIEEKCMICGQPASRTMFFVHKDGAYQGGWNYDGIRHGFCGKEGCLKKWSIKANRFRNKCKKEWTIKKYLEKMFWLVDRVSF